MKFNFRKYLLIVPMFLGVFAFPASAFASHQGEIASVTSPGGMGNNTVNFSLSVGSYYSRVGFKWNPRFDASVCSVKVKLGRSGSNAPSGRVYMDLYQNGNTLTSGTKIATSGNFVLGSTVPVNGQEYTFTFANDVCWGVVENGNYYISFYNSETPTTDGWTFAYNSNCSNNSDKIYYPNSLINFNLYGDNGTGEYNCGQGNKPPDGTNVALATIYGYNESSSETFAITNPVSGSLKTSQTFTVSGICESGYNVIVFSAPTGGRGVVNGPVISAGMCNGGTFTVTYDMGSMWNDDYSLYAQYYGTSTITPSVPIKYDRAGNTNEVPPPLNQGVSYFLPPWHEQSGFYMDCNQYDGLSFFTTGMLAGLACYTSKAVLWIVGVLVVPPEGVTDLLVADFEGFKQVFPFSVLFTVIDSMKTGLDSATGSQNLTFYIPEPFDHTFILLTPTLVEDVVGQNMKNLYFETVRVLLWLIAILIIIRMII